MLWTLLLAAELSLAEPPEAPPDAHAAVFLRGVVESWDDGNIGGLYRTGAFASGVGVHVPLPIPNINWVSIDVEAAYRRMASRDGLDAQFELIPISFIGEATFTPANPNTDLFAGLGPSWTTFTERHPSNPGSTLIRGARPGIEMRAGGRVNTGLVQPRSASLPQGLHAIELELYGARRFQRPGVVGFQLGAWRAGLGIGFRL